MILQKFIFTNCKNKFVLKKKGNIALDNWHSATYERKVNVFVLLFSSISVERITSSVNIERRHTILHRLNALVWFSRSTVKFRYILLLGPRAFWKRKLVLSFGLNAKTATAAFENSKLSSFVEKYSQNRFFVNNFFEGGCLSFKGIQCWSQAKYKSPAGSHPEHGNCTRTPVFFQASRLRMQESERAKMVKLLKQLLSNWAFLTLLMKKYFSTTHE